MGSLPPAAGPPRRLRTVGFAALALIAFAANSVLCRLALREGAMDAASFSTIRLMSGAIALSIISLLLRSERRPSAGSWLSAGMLSLYALPFSLAYTRLSTGTGALILFGSVQATMLIAALRSGERPHPTQWSGLAVALSGLVYLVFPGIAAPPFAAAALMALAGCSWGIYSVRGRSAADPLMQTTGNFVRAVPIVLGVSLAALTRSHVGARGVSLAVASGALASGLGYVAWYAALGGLTSTRAAIIQLAVPILAAAAGVVLLAEAVSPRLIISAVLVLGGVALAIAGGESSRRVRAAAA